jgi:hypothetical protein
MLQHHPSATSHAAASSPLEPGERLLMAALQAWAGAGSDAAACRETIRRMLAWRVSGRAAALFHAWVQAIEAARLRPIAARCPGCGGPSTDLQRLVVACGVAAVDGSLAEALVSPLVREPQTVAVLGRFLSAELAKAGWPLPARHLGETPSRPPRRLH